MSIGTWEPASNNESPDVEVTPELLQRFIAISQQESLAQIGDFFPHEQLNHHKRLMRLPKERWFALAENFDSEEIVHLIRFFTAAEMKLPGWEAGAKSPVVWLVKTLRKRGTPPTRELLLWIKSNSTNKYLPNGALI